jgi:hypothetical protein
MQLMFEFCVIVFAMLQKKARLRAAPVGLRFVVVVCVVGVIRDVCLMS